MKTEDGTILQEEDYIALYPCINVKHKNYEIWQHSYIKGDVLEDDPDFQLVYFNPDGSVDSYHVSSKAYRFMDKTHLGKLQLVYHNITLEFIEHTHLIKDAWSNETHVYFNKIIKRKEQASNETNRINQK